MNYFDYIAKKVQPKPAYQRQPPSKAKRAGVEPSRAWPREPEPKSEGIVVEESDASDSMILRIIGKFRGQ